MFEIYLNNLYRNLNLYNIQNSDKYTEIYKNKLKHMIGGNIDVERVQKLKELTSKYNDQLQQLRKREITGDVVTIDAQKFNLMRDLILYTTKQIQRDHESVKDSIDRMNNTIEGEKFKKITLTIDEINNMFTQLLS
jgi:hypothetical protein